MLIANEKALAKNKRELENVMNIIKAGIINDTIKESITALDEEKKMLEIENLKLKAKTKKELSEEDAMKFLVSLLKMDDNSPDYKKMMLDRFVKKVILYNDKIQIELYPIDKESIFDISNSNGGNNSGSGEIKNSDSIATKKSGDVSDWEPCCPPY